MNVGAWQEPLAHTQRSTAVLKFLIFTVCGLLLGLDKAPAH